MLYVVLLGLPGAYRDHGLPSVPKAANTIAAALPNFASNSTRSVFSEGCVLHQVVHRD